MRLCWPSRLKNCEETSGLDCALLNCGWCHAVHADEVARDALVLQGEGTPGGIDRCSRSTHRVLATLDALSGVSTAVGCFDALNTIWGLGLQGFEPVKSWTDR